MDSRRTECGESTRSQHDPADPSSSGLTSTLVVSRTQAALCCRSQSARAIFSSD